MRNSDDQAIPLRWARTPPQKVTVYVMKTGPQRRPRKLSLMPNLHLSRFRRAFNESHPDPAFAELLTKLILFS